MNARQSDSEELKALLARSGESEAPPWLLPRIMAEIEERPVSRLDRLRRWWSRPQAVQFSPARLVLTVALACCAFWLGMFVDRIREPERAGKPPVLADNGEANYLIGRGLLAAGRVDQALSFLRQAVRQDPQAAEFAHWQGVAYWQMGETEEEKQSYLESIADQPDYLPSLINLGHNYLESGQYDEAVAQYDKVLAVDPFEETALYNRALAFQLQNDSTRAEQAFLVFVSHYRTGKWALRAVGHLHRLGNFSFRSYRIGAVRLVLNTEVLLDQDSIERSRELQYLAEALVRAPGSELHLVSYHKGDLGAARAAASGLQEQLTAMLGRDRAVPVRGSWFDVAETFSDESGTEHQLPAGLLIFTRTTSHQRHNSI